MVSETCCLMMWVFESNYTDFAAMLQTNARLIRGTGNVPTGQRMANCRSCDRGSKSAGATVFWKYTSADNFPLRTFAPGHVGPSHPCSLRCFREAFLVIPVTWGLSGHPELPWLVVQCAGWDVWTSSSNGWPNNHKYLLFFALSSEYRARNGDCAIQPDLFVNCILHSNTDRM